MALLVFAIGLSATLYYWKNLRQGVDADLLAAYTHQEQTVIDTMSARIRSYQNFLSGSAGLFSIQSSLTETEWDKYHQPYNIPENYPDIQAVGAVRSLAASDVPAYLGRRSAQGDPNFTIYPAGQRPLYAVVTLETPYATTGYGRGYDMRTDAVLQAAMNAAGDTASLVMSGATHLPNDTHTTPTGFVLYLPVYKADAPTANETERQAALLGFVYVALDIRTFMDQIAATNQNANIGVRLLDGNTAVFQSSNYQDLATQPDVHLHKSIIRVYGHEWTYMFAETPKVLAARERSVPAQALWRGLITCVFFAGIVWYLITDRERTYARQKQQEVQTAKDDLLSLASHQLRTPATVVKQYVGMLLQGYGGELTRQQMNMLTSAYDSNERQLQIINQLLYVARLDANRITLRREQTDISKLVRSVVRDQQETITARDQHVSSRLPKRPAYAMVDPHYLHMALENLLSNAIKYTPEHGRITVRLQRSAKLMTITITDTGVGIEPAAQASIFEKFTRVENALSTDVNGSGVGLYLTKEIIELHGGRIEVRSEVGRGSTFVVSLPVDVEDTQNSSLKRAH